MRMLITIFLILFILGTQNVVYALATATTCGTKTSSTSCNTTAGCYWDNGTCSQCPGGTYKGTADTSCTQCPTTLLGDGVTWDTSILGQTSQNECHWTSTCDQSGQYTDPTGGCKYCQEKNDPNENSYYYLKILKTQTGTLDETDYFSTYCDKCGQNTQPTSNGATDCKCKTGYERIYEVLNTSTDCTAKKYTLTYKCAKNDEQAIFTQQYADIEHPCNDDNTINYIYYEKNFKIPTFLTSKSGVSTDGASQINLPTCLKSNVSQSYDPTPQKECKKTGHNLIGWQTPEGKAVLNIHGTNDEKSEILNSYKEYEIIEAKTDSEIKYKWDKDINLYPVWAAEKITCDGGQYFSAESAKCTDCPAGFYCPGVSDGTIDAENPKDIGRYPCPFGSTSDGSTSDTKSDAITDCYLKPGATKFCGASTGDCIYMPASAEQAHYTNATETSDE